MRFAGPRLAAADDDLIPVKLRRGGRTLGGSLSWEQPQQLAGFSRDSPFNGMAVPNDVTVTRQVLAEPDSGLTERTWATLADGTPLVTAARRGKGFVILFHVTADTRWSDLPLSGAFVDMLKRIVALAGSTATAETIADAAGSARGRAAEPRARRLRRVHAAAVDRAAGAGRLQRPRHRGSSARLLWPAGGAARREHARTRRPAQPDRLRAALRPHRGLSPRRAEGPARTALPRRARAAGDRRAGGVLARRRPVAADAAAAHGGGAQCSLAVATAALLRGAARLRPGAAARPRPPGASRADPAAEDFAQKVTTDTRLAYVITGDAEVDNISKAGLAGLTLFLAQRTALEAGDPVGLDLGARRALVLPADLLADRAERRAPDARPR